MRSFGCALVLLSLSLMSCAPPSHSPEPSPPEAGQLTKPPDDTALPEGSWLMVSNANAKEKAEGEAFAKLGNRVYFHNRILFLKWGDQIVEGTFRVDPTQTPKVIHFVPDMGQPGVLIYELNGNELKLRMGEGDQRPKELAIKPGDKGFLFGFQRDPRPVALEPEGVRVTATNKGPGVLPYLSLDFGGTTVYFRDVEPGSSKSFRVKPADPAARPPSRLKLSFKVVSRLEYEDLGVDAFEPRDCRGTIHIDVAEGQVKDVRADIKPKKP